MTGPSLPQLSERYRLIREPLRRQAAAGRSGPMTLKDANDLIARTRRARQSSKRE